MITAEIDTGQLDRFIQNLTTYVPTGINNIAFKTVYDLTKYAMLKMKLYAPHGGMFHEGVSNKGLYSKGRLRNAITREIRASTFVIKGKAFVKRYITYQRYVEYGVKRRSKNMKLRGVYAIPYIKWFTVKNMKATRTKRGLFYFLKQFIHGTYKGYFYREKAYKDTLSYWKSYSAKIPAAISNLITITK